MLSVSTVRIFFYSLDIFPFFPLSLSVHAPMLSDARLLLICRIKIRLERTARWNEAASFVLLMIAASRIFRRIPFNIQHITTPCLSRCYLSLASEQPLFLSAYPPVSVVLGQPPHIRQNSPAQFRRKTAATSAARRREREAENRAWPWIAAPKCSE